MSSSPSDWPADWIVLRSGEWTAAVDPLGAQLSILRDAQGRDLLWNGDPKIWAGRSPILFPIVGALNGGQYRWRGQRYALPRHGLARTRRFEIIRNEERELLFRLFSDAETLRHYPFRFELDVSYRLEGRAFVMEATVHNRGGEPMPASLGFHPAFRWPLPYGAARNAHDIQFAFAEPAPIRRLDDNGLVLPTTQPSPVRDRQLLLDDALFAQDVVIFDRLVSRQLSYGVADVAARATSGAVAMKSAPESPRLLISFAAATHLGLWTRPGAPFVCIEPWRGVADPVGFDEEFERKPGLFRVPPGDSRSLAMQIESSDSGE